MIGGRAVRWHHIVHTFSCGHRRCVLSLNAKFPLHRPGAAGHTQHQHLEDDRRQTTHTHSRWNRKSFKRLRVRHMQFESFVNYSIAIPFYKFSHVFFLLLVTIYTFSSRTHAHTHTALLAAAAASRA